MLFSPTQLKGFNLTLLIGVPKLDNTPHCKAEGPPLGHGDARPKKAQSSVQEVWVGGGYHAEEQQCRTAPSLGGGGAQVSSWPKRVGVRTRQLKGDTPRNVPFPYL